MKRRDFLAAAAAMTAAGTASWLPAAAHAQGGVAAPRQASGYDNQVGS